MGTELKAISFRCPFYFAMLSGRWQYTVLTTQKDPSHTQPVVWARLIIAYLGRKKKIMYLFSPGSTAFRVSGKRLPMTKQAKRR